MLGSSEIIVIAIVVLVLFGASAIPKFAKSLGEAKKEFDKSSKQDADKKIEDDKKNSDGNSTDGKEDKK